MLKFLYLPLLMVFISCSYTNKLPDKYSESTVNIPYVKGDEDGQLTHSLVYQLSAAGALEYKQIDADYVLLVSVLDVSNDKIGYRKDRDLDGKLRDNLMPIESRQSIKAEVSLKSTTTDEIVWGPRTISADIDYDYVEQDALKDLSFVNSSGKRETILSYSLGQLESVPSAQISVRHPLYQNLAKNIVTAIIGELNE